VVLGDPDEPDKGEVFTYFFNPYFAKTVRPVPNDFAGGLEISDSEQISVRSARHLYDLSLYHDVYADELEGKNVTFLQERDISYSAYDWKNYFNTLVRLVDRQEPIGRTDAHPFKSNYNGQCYSIKDVSFVSQHDDYVGLFGYNEGELRNIVVRTDFDADSDRNYLVQRVEDISTNSRVYMGVIAGYNGPNGIIYNCAAAGYYIAGSDGTIHAYSNSHVYIGGLAGANEGRIQNCASDCPTLRVSALNAEGYIGGFVGSNNNSGMIYNCYALGHINVAFSRGGSVNLSGFAGINNGTITNSYCAVSLLSAGETSVTYAFAPIGGAVSNNYYLDRGTYTYVNILHSYSSNRERTAGESCTRGELIALRGRARVDSAHTFNYPNTKAADQAYPYRGVVRDRAGSYVHYGDWQDDAVLGTLGVFYWEHERSGANDGYHLTYIGTDEGLSDSGTTLCNEHDDGGIITEYGYGYYVKVGQEQNVTSTLENLVWSGSGAINTEAQRQFHMQMQDYTFYPFTTKTERTGDYICLDGGMDDRDGKLTLSFTNAASETTEYVYNISPFFANAISSSRSGKVTSSSGKVTDFSKPLGSEENPYEVRSIEQFQFINWNCETKNCSTLVTGTRGSAGSGNYQKFPYLQYATVLDKGVQTRSAVEALRPPQFWLQTHDLHGSSGKASTPIAGMATSTSVSNGSYRNILFAWFGGNYDGQSYKIQDVDVISDSYTVGLFGVVAGANIKNIILYGDGTNVVKRDTLIAGGQVGEKVGAYQIGGLIGIAYEYKSSTISNKISNCAIAGYKVIDGSTNQQGAGTANVGGLIGLANINLDGCSSVVDVVLDCTHDNGHMCWGSYFRIGGLTGSAGAPGAQVYVRNCYTGGSISVTDRTLNERPTRFDGNGFALRDSGSVGYSSNLFISGMVGGSYAPNISNFSDNESNRPDGTANIENCYTYIQLPDLEGTIRSVSLFASQADRYNRASELRITNCYYLSSIAENIRHPDRNDPTTWPSYFFVSSKNLVSGGKAPTEAEWAILRDEDGTADPVQRAALIDKFKNLVISEEEFTAMLNGNLSCLKKYLNNQQDNPAAPLPSPATGIDFGALGDQSDTASNMAARLNSGTDVWTWVTVTEGMGAQIDGKYSFSSNPAQSGKNYPFPTVITQKDTTYASDVNVHYGEWPIDGVYWAEGLAEMDIFDDMTSSGWAEKEFTLIDTKGLLDASGITLDSFSVTPGSIGQIVAVDKGDPTHIKVTVRAKKDGAVTVTENVSGTQASFIVNITSNLIISSEPDHVKNYASTSSEALLTARSMSGTDFSDAGEWSVAENPLIEIVADPSQPNRLTVTHDQPCAINPETTFRYSYNGVQYVFGGFLPIQTYGFLGLAPISSLNADGYYSVAERVPSGNAVGETKTYSVNAPSLPESSDGEFYIYEAISDEALYYIDVNTVTVSFTDALSQPHVCVYTINADGEGVAADGSEDLFEILIHDPASFDSDLNYNYLPGSIRYKGDGAAPEVSLEIVLNHGEDFVMNGEDKEFTVYTLRTTFRTHNYQVTFKPNGGSGTTSPIRTPAGDITLPSCGFEKTGYSFIGWEDLNGTVCQPGESYLVNGDADFTALWAPIGYTVVFDPAFTTDQTMAPMTFVYDEAQTLTANTFTRPGHIFMGWSLRSGGTVAHADAEAVMNLSDTDGATVTLYARWGASFTVTLRSNNSLADPDQVFSVISGFTETLEGYTKPEEEGYILVGWFTAADDGIKILNEDASIANAIPGYTTFAVFSPTEDRVLYAHWREIPKLTLDPNTGDPSDVPQVFVIPDGAFVTELSGYAAPADRDGYIFEGWFTDASGGTLTVNPDGTIAGTVAGYTAFDDVLHFELSQSKTLYAHWYKIPVLTLDANTGDPTDEPQLFNIPDASVTELTGYVEPDRTGYVFDGWFTEASDGTKVLDADGTITEAAEGYTDGTHFTLTEDKTLYAHWTKIPALILNVNLPGTGTIEYPISGENVSVPEGYAAPDLEGCTLLGWYTEADGGELVLNADGTVAAAVAGYTDGTYITITEDKTLYGHWNVPTKVYLVSDGVTTEFDSTDFATSSAPAGYTAPSGLYSYGYTFEGWYGLNSSDEYVKVLKDWGALEADNVDGFVTDGVLRPGVTLYAKWTTTANSVDYTPDAADLALAGGWNKAIPNVNWDLGDYIEVTMRLHKGTQLKQNVISFGLSWQDLYNFNKNQSAFHLTYPRNNNSNTVLRVTEMLAQKNVERFYGDGKYVTVRLSKDGLFLSNAYDAPGEELTFTEALHATDAAYNNNYHDLIENRIATGNGQMIFVGNIQGTQRSEATDYSVTLVKPAEIYG
ncbi:MAG: InlB B-repeat-containing protein, partial [Clostridia bacterium]|nr:InlB B-repeat-containing protein [Clostridia bacterium]